LEQKQKPPNARATLVFWLLTLERTPGERRGAGRWMLELQEMDSGFGTGHFIEQAAFRPVFDRFLVVSRLVRSPYESVRGWRPTPAVTSSHSRAVKSNRLATKPCPTRHPCHVMFLVSLYFHWQLTKYRHKPSNRPAQAVTSYLVSSVQLPSKYSSRWHVKYCYQARNQLK
jgi:hypothetical protein